jgi:hypothetical protein
LKAFSKLSRMTRAVVRLYSGWLKAVLRLVEGFILLRLSKMTRAVLRLVEGWLKAVLRLSRIMRLYLGSPE